MKILKTFKMLINFRRTGYDGVLLISATKEANIGVSKVVGQPQKLGRPNLKNKIKMKGLEAWGHS
jgi:hypothetical protein